MMPGKLHWRATRGDDVENGYYEEVSDDDTILDLIGEIHDVNSVKEFSVEEFIEEFEKQQGKEQEDIQIDENNNYVEDEIICISSDVEITNEERGLDVSKMKNVIETVMITRTVQTLNGHEVGSHVEVETSYYEHSCWTLGPGVSQTAICVLWFSPMNLKCTFSVDIFLLISV